VCGEGGGEVDRAGAFGAVEAPDGFGDRRGEVDGFATVAPAGSDGEGDADVFSCELFGAVGGFGGTTDAGVGEDDFDGETTGVADVFGDEGSGAGCHGHGDFFKRFTDAAIATVDSGANPNLG